MSAEIGSVETKAGADMSEELEEAVTGVGALNIVPIESRENLPSNQGDAADFLLSNSKYHDSFLTVGNPEYDKVNEGIRCNDKRYPVYQKVSECVGKSIATVKRCSATMKENQEDVNSRPNKHCARTGRPSIKLDDFTLGEKIGVASLYLIANSPVFREMLETYKQTNLSQAKLKITDVSPATFKLMLRFIYGGKLPKMTTIETAGLALCADKYKIPRLVQKSLKRLVPSAAEDVFPALICVTFASFPDLEVRVSKIIQQETDKIVQSADFLKLDEHCVLFILKQDTLNIDEVEVWKHVVRWAEHQAEVNPTRTVRDCLAKSLGHVRFLTFTTEEMLEHVLPTMILSPEEYMDLSLALTKKRTLVSPLLCKIQERRNLYKEEASAIPVVEVAEGKTKVDEKALLLEHPGTLTFSTSDTFKISDYYDLIDVGYCRVSSFSIKPTDFIEITSITWQGIDKSRLNNQLCMSCGRKGDQKKSSSYQFSCYITVTKTINSVVSERVIKIIHAGKYDRVICLDISDSLLEEGKDPLVLSPDATWTFTLDFNFAHPVYNLVKAVDRDDSADIDTPLNMNNITFFSNQCSVMMIDYMKR